MSSGHQDAAKPVDESPTVVDSRAEGHGRERTSVSMGESTTVEDGTMNAGAELDKRPSTTSKISQLVHGPKDLFLFPVPRRLRWDPAHPHEFTLLLNVIFGVAATGTVASLYYPQPILIVLSREFNVSYSAVTDIPTLLQASYAVGLLLICPTGDLLRRRQLLLALVLASIAFTLACVFIKNVVAFEVVSFFLGLVTVTPQVLLPLAGDLSRPERRAQAIATVMSGLLLGILFARVMAGTIAEFGSKADVYWMSFGFQVLIFIMLYLTVPDYPAKNPDLSYFEILRTMCKLAVTEPVLIQGCLIAICCSAVFSCYWTSSTFVLGTHYGYNSLDIGLFALIGMAGVSAAPFLGRLIDSLVLWTGVLVGLLLLVLGQVVFTAAAEINISAIVIVILLLDIGQQMQQVSNSTRIFAVNAAARARMSAVYIFCVFLGQLIGTRAGTEVYLKYGWRASGGFCLGLLACALFVLCMRGPHLPSNKAVGWTGGWELRKDVAERKAAERAATSKTRDPESQRNEDMPDTNVDKKESQ